jgi:hypothetical protein
VTLRFRVGPYYVPVEWMTDKGDLKRNDGTYHPIEGVRISPKARPDEQCSTLIHEILHSVWDIYRLPDAVTEEQAATLLEGPLMALIVDNPHLRPILEMGLVSNLPLPLDE